MYAHTTDYRPNERGWINRGFWLHNIPRPLVACRILGHKPVVDGTTGIGTAEPARWVCCDRCGMRPHPQGTLSPALWDLGDPYAGRFDNTVTGEGQHKQHTPGPFPRRDTWTFGGQVVAFGSPPGFSASAKLGNRGSEHTLEGHLRLGRLFALYLHTEILGTWLQRRLNPTGYESKITSVGTNDGDLHWRLWASRGIHTMDTPRWRDGSIRINPLDIVLGERRYSYTDVGEPVPATLRMPHGDDHPVTLQLQRRVLGRKRGGQRVDAWTVDCDIESPGVRTKPGRGGVTGLAADVDADAVNEDRWVEAALAALAEGLAATRDHYGYEAA